MLSQGPDDSGFEDRYKAVMVYSDNELSDPFYRPVHELDCCSSIGKPKNQSAGHLMAKTLGGRYGCDMDTAEKLPDLQHMQFLSDVQTKMGFHPDVLSALYFNPKVVHTGFTPKYRRHSKKLVNVLNANADLQIEMVCDPFGALLQNWHGDQVGLYATCVHMRLEANGHTRDHYLTTSITALMSFLRHLDRDEIIGFDLEEDPITHKVNAISIANEARGESIVYHGPGCGLALHVLKTYLR